MKNILLMGMLAALALPAVAWADTDNSTSTTTDDAQHRLGFGIHASTLGLGPELNFTVNPYLVVRLDYNYYNDYSFDTTKDQVNYDAHLRLNNYGAALDWHPMAGGFLISVGLFKDNNFIDAVANPQQSYVINGQTFTAGEVGTLNGHITFNSWAPYLGIGWNSLGSTKKGVGVELGLGVLYQGSPSVALSPSGPITAVPGLAQATQQEQQKLDAQWNSYKYYPVVNVGLVFRF
ncbi:MAG TPA: hypothetical protein VGH71_07545 [Gammaproteobacteria bacterium]